MTAPHWSQSLSVSINENYEHSFGLLTLIIFTCLTYVASLLSNILFATGTSLLGIKLLHFPENSYAIFGDYETHLIPSKVVLYLWIFIFLYQLAWLIYGVTTIFRKSSSDYLYKYPPVMHWLVYLNFAGSNLLYILSLVFWSRQMFIFSAAYSLLTFIGLYIGVFISLFKLSDYQREMYYTEKSKDVWYIRMLVQNGLFAYATWAFVIFLLMLNLSLVNELGVSKQAAHLIILILALVKLILYFISENFLAYNYCKFLITPWIIMAIFLIDTLINQTLRSKLNLYTQVSPFKSRHLDQHFSHTKLNLETFVHYFVISFYLILFIGKIIKFVYKEFFFTRKFSHYF